MNEDNNFTEWYQERFKQLNEQPPKDVWNNISRELDINDTWEGVDLKLNFIARRKTIIRRTSSALVLLLLLFISGGMVRYLLNDSEKKINLAVENVNTLEINDNSFLPEKKKEINFTKPEKDTKSGNSVESKQTTKSLSSIKHVSVKRKTTKENTIVYSTDSEQTAKSLSSLEEVNVKSKEANGNAVVYSTESIQTVKSLSSLEEVNVKSKEANGSTEVYSTENIQTAKSLSSLEEVNVKSKEANGNAEVYNTKNNPSPLNSNFKTITDNQKPIAAQANAGTNAEAEELLAIPVEIAFINVRETDSINSLVLNFCPDYLAHTFNNGFQGWNIGAFYSTNNTWLLNNQTLNIIESTSLNELELNFGNAYGLTAAYNFNTHVSGEFNWSVNSKQGQTSHFYNEGRYQTNAIKLNYTVFNLSLKHRKEGKSKYFNAPKSINFVAGINVGVLKYGTDAIESSQIKSKHSNTDYGLRIGYEYEILAFKKIVFSSAILGNIGLKNIYKESAYKATSYKVGYNALLGFQLGVKYILK